MLNPYLKKGFPANGFDQSTFKWVDTAFAKFWELITTFG